MANPDYCSFIECAWGWPPEYAGDYPFFAGASNIVIGTNPPYTAADFTALYPAFEGPPTLLQGATDGTTALLSGLASATGLAAGQLVIGPGVTPGSAILAVTVAPLAVVANVTLGAAALSGITSTAGCYVGQPIAGPGIPAGTTITAVGNTTLGISNPGSANFNGASLTVTTVTLTLSAVTLSAQAGIFSIYTAPLVPLAILNVYIALASASLVQARWLDSWTVGMGVFIAHYLTLWLKADSGNGGSAAQVAQAGLAFGIQTSKGAGKLSVGYTVLDIDQQWGAFALTIYGQLFITMAKGIGGGMMVIW